MYERIKKLCQELGLTIPELEERAGISSGAISHWRTSSPKAHNVLSVAAVLGCSVDYLLTGNTPQRSGLRIPPIPESESPKSGLRIRGIEKSPASTKASGVEVNPHYYELSESERAAVDALIDHYATNHQSGG